MAKTRGWAGLRCVLCGEADGVTVKLEDTSVLACLECGETFDPKDVREMVATWVAVLAWIESAPLSKETRS